VSHVFEQNPVKDESLSNRIYAKTCAEADKYFCMRLDDWFQASVSAATKRLLA